jgi:uncharacterized membrane-anchored protein
MRHTFLVFILLSASFISRAQEVDSTQLFMDSLEASFNYQTGTIALDDSLGSITVPEGFRFLDAKHAQFVLTTLWGNPEDPTTLGMIVPKDHGVTAGDAWAFIVSYEEIGYVEDDDAEDIDYEELLEGMKTDTKESNAARIQQGYDSITLVGWASSPFYDGDKKVLYWAKELKFGDAETNTLNYDIRILGRKGIMSLNAVSSIDQLDEVKTHIDPILSSFTYAEGKQYDDFNPDIDEVAAWTIGGLVAGKLLAKAGILALILKNIKLIGLAIIAAATGLWNWFKRKTQPPTVRDITNNDQA